MKPLITGLIALFFSISCTLHTASGNDPSTFKDKTYNRNIVGQWAEGKSPYNVFAFSEGGAYKSWTWSTDEKLNLIITIKGKWWIKDGKLFTEMIEMEPQLPNFTPSTVAIEEIKQIDENKMITVDADGLENISTKVDDPA